LDQQRAELEIRLSDGQANQQKSDEQTQELEKRLSEANARTGEDNAEEAKAARAALKDVKNQFEELLAKQLENSTVQQEQLETQLNKMLQEQQQLETQVRHSVEEKQTLEKELEALKKEKSADRSADLKKELTALQAALEKQKTQYKANLSLLNEREQELQEARNNIRDLNEQTVPQEDLQQTEARAAELESTLTALNSRLLKLSQDNEQLKRQLSSKTPELEQNNARLRESEKKLAETKATILELDRQKSELETRLSAGLADRQRSDEQTQELEKRLSEANAKILELDRQKRELETRLLDGQAQQQDAGQQKDAEILRLKDELLKAADYINNTNTQLSELQQKNTELNAQLRESQQTTANLQAQITQSSDTVQGQNQEVSRLQDQLTILQSQFQDSVQDNNSTNTQLSELQQKNTALNAQLRESQQTTANLQAQITQSSDTVQGQNQEVSRLQDQLTILQSQFQDSEQNNKVLQDEITDLDRRLTVQGSVPEEAKNRIQQLTQELQGTRIKLQQQQQLEREYPMLQQQVQHLQTQVAALEKAGENAILFEGRSEELQIAFDESRRETKSLMEQNISLQEELDNRAETYQTQGRKFQEFSQRNQELEQQYQQGLQELALKEKLLQQALLEKSVLEKALDDEGPRHDQQQIVTLQKKLQAYQASELRDAEYSRLVTDLQEKLQNTEARNSLLQKEVLELQQSSLQVPKTPAEAPAENSGQLSTLEQQIALLETELTDSRQYVQRLQQQLATADINPTSSPAISADNFLSRFFPAGLGSGGSVSVLGSSPDNSKLAYLESNEQQQRLFIFNTLSRQAIQITEWPRSADTSTSGSRFAWAFDSEHFLFATGTPGNYVLYLGNSRKLLGQAIQLHEAHIAFAWSPAQSQFAYFSGSSLIIQNLQQQTLSIQLGHQPGLEETSLAWSPDGRQIAICARQGDSFDIFLLGFANNTPSLQTLVASSSDDLLPSWSPDGRYLAFYVRADRYDTKIAVSPSDKSRAPYIVGHNASLPPAQGPRWISGTELSYVGE
ncbi:MAG: hypothetical protein GY801_34055, partial [bacterium]|nr:hypothetical protein [bacterium]